MRIPPGLIVHAPIISFGLRAMSVTTVCRSGERLHSTAADGLALETLAAGRGLAAEDVEANQR
jgi:hypothetical protein